MELRLLGEVQLWVGDRLLDLGTPRQQAVLVALAVDAGRPVSIEILIDRVWDNDPPVKARDILYSHLSRIRHLLKQATSISGADARIDRRSAGYVLDMDPDLVDLHQFVRLVKQGKNMRKNDTDRAAILAEALSLWRGPPLAGVSGEWMEQVRSRWHRRRLDAIVLWCETELKLGRVDSVVNALPDLITEYPLVEPLEGLYMRALHAAGRQGEAIDRYTAVRQRLADELGIDPGMELRALHSAILRGKPSMPVRVGQLVVPAQLPPDVPGFVGRNKELQFLESMINSGSRAVRIIVVSGTAGVGKTALAVHWAHQIRDRFPDGHLYLNLRGFDPTGSPVTAAEAVRSFLDAFDIQPQRIPASLDSQIGLYRSLLSNRRVLIVLDNACGVEQVRSLLPGAPGCLVLVTSRDALAGLVAAGADPLTIDLLDDGEGRELLARRLGAHRVEAEPHAVREIVALCARLPLALAVVAARAVRHPTFGLTALADELRETRGSLEQFANADPATDPRAVFGPVKELESLLNYKVVTLSGRGVRFRKARRFASVVFASVFLYCGRSGVGWFLRCCPSAFE